MYFLYSLGGVTFNKCWITLSILSCYSPNFQGFILMKNALNNQVGMLVDMFLWLVANLKQGVIYFIKQEGGNHKIAWVYHYLRLNCNNLSTKKNFIDVSRTPFVLKAYHQVYLKAPTLQIAGKICKYYRVFPADIAENPSRVPVNPCKHLQCNGKLLH